MNQRTLMSGRNQGDSPSPESGGRPHTPPELKHIRGALSIEFPFLGQEQPRALWQSRLRSHYSRAHRDRNHLAALAALADGHIRGAVLAAAVVTQTRPINCTDVCMGLADEYWKIARQVLPEFARIS